MTSPSIGADLGEKPAACRFIPLGLCLAGWLTGIVAPGLLVKLGVHDYGMRFLDSYALLAALDAARAGADPHGANVFDVLLRPHVYSDWWLGLRWLGLGREHNAWFATASVGLFIAAIGLIMRPRRLADSIWLAVLLVSPVVALAMSRANNDLLIFVLLAACGVMASGAGSRLGLGIGLLGLATGLKYYPAAAAVAFLWLKPSQWKWGCVLVAGATAALVLGSVWSQIERGRFMIGPGVYTMGAPIWWRDLGWSEGNSIVATVLILGVIGVVCAGSGITSGLASEGDRRDRILTVIGAAILLVCFVAGVNYAYRWIFVLWPAWWLWFRATDKLLPRRTRWAACFACAMILAILWQDGLLCMVINAQRPHDGAWLDRMQRLYRLGVQPFHWALMGMLAGWLLEGAVSILRVELRSARGSET